MVAKLNAKAFLERVWPDTGPYYVAIPFVNKETGKKGYAHYGCDTIEDASAKALSLCFSEAKDVYFCIHAVTEKKRMDPAKGFMRADRTHANMREAKVFFCELDVGPEEEPLPGKAKVPKYATREDAIAGLERFLFRTALPRPLVVSSGGGYHVYWVLTDTIPSLEWRGHADRLRFLFRKHGLKNDPMRTTDQSSVLRVAGTQHRKDLTNIRPVRCIDEGAITDTAEFLSLLQAQTSDYEPLAAVYRAQQGAAGTGLEFSGRFTPVQEVFDICAQAKHFEEMKGQVSEPEWYNMLGLLRFAHGGEERAHLISSGYPGYTHEETQTKMDQWADKNPPTCKTIRDKAGHDHCSDCPLYNPEKNPLIHSNKAWEAKAKPVPKVEPVQLNANAGKPTKPTYDPVEITPPYGRTNGGIGKYVMDPEEKVMVLKHFCTYDMFPLAAYRADAEQDEDAYSLWCVTYPQRGQVILRFPDNIFHGLNEFRKAMVKFQIHVPADRDLSELMAFMKHYLRQLQTQTIEDDMFNYLGWVRDDAGKPKTFVLFEQAWDFQTQTFRQCAMSKSMASSKPMFGRAGTLQGQLASLQFFNSPDCRRMQYMMLASLASPYFFITGEAGVILCMSGKTASSKTTTARACAAIWAVPDVYMINGLAAGSTFNAKIDRMMLTNNLPFIMDEFTKADPKEVNEIALLASQPGGRATLTKYREIRIHRSGNRSNILLVTSNDSLIQLCSMFDQAGTAAQTRIVEVPFPKMLVGKAAAERALREIMSNYGHIGPAVMELLLPDHEAVCEEIRDLMDQMTETYRVKPEERFRVNHLAVLLAVGRRAHAAGLFPFDPDEIIKWFVTEQLPRMRKATVAATISNDEIIAQFMGDIHGETIRIEIDPKGNLGGALIIPNQKIAARFEIGSKELAFATSRFKRWCDERRVNYMDVVNELTREGRLSQGRRNLTIGVETTQLPRIDCYVIDVGKFQAVVQKAAK